MIKSVLILTLFCTYGYPFRNEIASQSSMESEILELVNEYRASKDLLPLRDCNVCAKEALTHSRKMAKGLVPFGHDGFKDRFQHIAEKSNVKSAAENVAEGYMSAQEVVNGWIESKGHRENMEGDYTHLGTGIAKGSEGTRYFTQIFIKI
ncbi:MAG: CAP domain-containing protein [Cyclobacteriaceae bacterium]